MRTNVKTHTGNRILVKFDGKTVGLGQTVRGSDDYAPDAASGIGDIHVQEYVPTQARHSVNVSMMALKKDSLMSAGIMNVNGDDALKGNVFDLEIYDKDTGKLVKKYVDCYHASGDIEITKHAIVTYNAVFLALDVTGDMTATA
ncbi:MAG: hypothetical protein ACYCX4_01730 [Bacillota bacterium]